MKKPCRASSSRWKREHILLAAARRVFSETSDQDQRRFDGIFRDLCVDPSLGAPIPTLLDQLPDFVYRYNVGGYYVVYDLPDAATVRVWIIGKGPG
jgi:hypothetical protein